LPKESASCCGARLAPVRNSGEGSAERKRAKAIGAWAKPTGGPSGGSMPTLAVFHRTRSYGPKRCGPRNLLSRSPQPRLSMAPRVGLEPTTWRLTAGRASIARLAKSICCAPAKYPMAVSVAVRFHGCTPVGFSAASSGRVAIGAPIWTQAVHGGGISIAQSHHDREDSPITAGSGVR
jgi:hypothetical protein